MACPLCRTGVLPEGVFPEVDLHALDGDGFGALHHACYANRNPKVVEVLLKWGCNIEQKNQPFLERPLHLAALYRHEEHLQILLNAGAQVDATNYQGQSPIDYLKRESFMNLGGGNEQHCLKLLESKVSSPAAKQMANRLREEGNAAYRKQDFFDAARAYSESLEAYGLDARVYANRAAVWLELAKLTSDNMEKRHMFQRTCSDCERCIALDSKNLKAYFRLAMASMGLKDFPQALRIACDALKACKCMAGNQPLQKLRDDLRARGVPFFEGVRNPFQTASRNALQAVAAGAPYKPCSWCCRPALLEGSCPHCPHCGCDPFSDGPGALPDEYGVAWEDAEVSGIMAETISQIRLNYGLAWLTMRICEFQLEFREGPNGNMRKHCRLRKSVQSNFSSLEMQLDCELFRFAPEILHSLPIPILLSCSIQMH